MRELQELGRELVDKIGKMGFKDIQLFVEVVDRENSRVELSFTGEEGKARTFQGYIQGCEMHYNDAYISFQSSPECYRIKINPIDTKHEINRKTALVHAMYQLIKDIDNYHLKK